MPNRVVRDRQLYLVLQKIYQIRALKHHQNHYFLPKLGAQLPHNTSARAYLQFSLFYHLLCHQEDLDLVDFQHPAVLSLLPHYRTV